MGFSPNTGSQATAPRKSANYRVRFRNGVYPKAEVLATRADIKKYDYFFSGTQPWVATPEKIDFVDESAQVIADLTANEARKFTESIRRPCSRLTRTRSAEMGMPSTSWGSAGSTWSYSDPEPSMYLPCTSGGTAPSTASSSPRETHFPYHRQASPGTSSISSLEGNPYYEQRQDRALSAIPMHIAQSHRISNPIADPNEARLFRFWNETVSSWWDITSSNKIFKELVPRLALSNPMLLDAVLMTSAQHIQRFDVTYPSTPYFYHERLSKQLITYLAERGRVQDEPTLVAAVLLRGFEETHAGTRGQNHLSTYELFHDSQGNYLFDMTSPLVEACYMIHVHCEVYQALLLRPSLRVDYRSYALPNLAHPLDDVAWGNRMTWICARILQWASSDQRTMDDWQRHKDTVDEWERDRPKSFDAFYHRAADPESRNFQELWFPNPCHADAHQHLQICRMALTSSYARAEHCQSLRDEIENYKGIRVTERLNEMVAVARCNSHASTAPYITAHAIHKYAMDVRNRSDQNNLMEFLDEVEAVGWPTKATQELLCAGWGWQAETYEELGGL